MTDTSTVPYTPEAPMPSNGQKLSNDEKRRRHQKVVRFFDSGDFDGMTLGQIAEALGVTTDTVRTEAKARGLYEPRSGPLRAGKVTSGRASTVGKLPPGEAERTMTRFFGEYPGAKFTVPEIAERTGLKEASIRTVLGLRGLTAERREGASRSEYGYYTIPGSEQDQPQDTTAGQPAEPVSHGEEPASHGMTYAGRTSDGRLIARVEGTDVLWTLVLGSPL